MVLQAPQVSKVQLVCRVLRELLASQVLPDQGGQLVLKVPRAPKGRRAQQAFKESPAPLVLLACKAQLAWRAPLVL